MQKRTGMFVHGLNLNDPEWHEIIWGKPPHLLGRATMALYLLDTEYPYVEHVLFGSGASERDGVKEGAYIIQYLLDNWRELRRFDVFGAHWWPSMRKLQSRLKQIAEPEIKSHNTFTELENGIPRLYAHGCRRIVLVTEITHISRAIAHGGEVLWKTGLLGKVSLVGEHSMVTPAKLNPEEVVVFEPRADGQNELVPNLRRIFRIPGEKRGEFNEKFDAVLTEIGV